MFAANTLVVGVFFLRVVGHITYALKLRNPLKQGAFDAFAQGHVCLAAAIPMATDSLCGHWLFCGSGLAREGGGSVATCIDWHTAFASKPAPTV